MENKIKSFELLKNEQSESSVKNIFESVKPLVEKGEVSDIIIVYVSNGYINSTRSHMYDTQMIGYLEAAKASILDDMKQ